MREHELNSHASAWMKRGIALLGAPTTQNLEEAIRCFDAAIELRRQLPVGEHPWFAYVLAAGWMNRADALTRLEILGCAVDSYDAALAALSHLDPEDDPRYRRRLALCWTNRAHTLLASGRHEEALSSIDRALESLGARSDEHPEVLAAALTNRANALLLADHPDECGAAARQALTLLAARERHEVEAADMALKARLLLCRALLLPPRTSISIAVDYCEDGLQLVRFWEERGETALRPWTLPLLRFGTRAYAAHQPHFLTEFLEEHMHLLPEFRAEAREILSRSLWGEIHRDGFRALSDGRAARFSRDLRKLDQLSEHEGRPPTTNSKQPKAERPPVRLSSGTLP